MKELCPRCLSPMSVNRDSRPSKFAGKVEFDVLEVLLRHAQHVA